MKSVLITGATSGLGESLAKSFISEYTVFCIGRNSKKLANLRDLGCQTLEVDFLQDDSWVQNLSEFCPEVDILINNAGIFPIKSLKQSSISDYDECFKINVRAPFVLMKNYLEKMRKNGYGYVINILSSSAYNGSSDTGIYCASKHALLGMTRSAFLEYRGTGVRVCSVSPGSMQTPMGATDKRQDFSTFIDVQEVVDFIQNLVNLNSTMVIDEVRLNRAIIR